VLPNAWQPNKDLEGAIGPVKSSKTKKISCQADKLAKFSKIIKTTFCINCKKKLLVNNKNVKTECPECYEAHASILVKSTYDHETLAHSMAAYKRNSKAPRRVVGSLLSHLAMNAI